MSVDTDIEKVRLAIGDTDTTNAIFKDAEITYFLTEESSNIANSALRACYAAAAKFARAYDFETDGQRFLRSQQYKAFLDLIAQLKGEGATLATSSGMVSTALTKVDAYSEDLDAEDTTSTSQNPRQRHIVVGGYDELP